MAGGGFTRTGHAYLNSPGCRKNKHPVMGQREGREDPAPDPAAESEKPMIARRPEMYPTEITPSGMSPLGKEATSGQPGPSGQRWGVAVSVSSTAPATLWSWRLGVGGGGAGGRFSSLSHGAEASSHLPEGGRSEHSRLSLPGPRSAPGSIFTGTKPLEAASQILY